MIKLAVAALVASALAGAPFQCGHDPDPNLRREDTAGDALWELAQKFHDEHNDQAARDTLKFLVDRYPSNRHTEAAKEQLGKLANPSAGGGGAPRSGADGG